MKRVIIPTAEQVVFANKIICEKSGNTHSCYGIGKIESVLYTAFYPGTYPFAAGGIAKTAGAPCFYLVKSHAFMDGNKRTGTLVAIVFMNENGWGIKYPLQPKKNINALAEVIDGCAAGKVSKDELIEWFDSHKYEIA